MKIIKIYIHIYTYICIHEVHAQASIFLRQLHVSNILCMRRFYLARAHVFTTTFIVTCYFHQSYASGIDCKLKNNISDRWYLCKQRFVYLAFEKNTLNGGLLT